MKRHVGDLAIFGGFPGFPEKLYVGRPNIGDRNGLFTLMRGILDSHWLTNHGPVVQEFERRVAAIAGAPYCVATCNATLALQLALKSMGVTGEVIVPSFTFVATAHAVSWLGLTPVFCDIDPVTQTLDPGLVESLITPATSGIIGVHLWGRPCDVARLEDIAARHGLALLFDGAHALGCRAAGQPIGGFGDATVFSFHATKFVNSFEGGALVTRDAELAEKVKAMQNFGQTAQEEICWLGTNAKMTEVAAAMGLVSLENMPTIVSRNRANHGRYAVALDGLAGIQVMPYDEANDNNHQYVVIEVDGDMAGIDRDTLREVLRAENVMCPRYFYPGCHRLSPYRSSLSLPHTEAVAARVLELPTGTTVTPDDVDRVCELIRFAVANGADVTRRRGQPSVAVPG